MKDYKNNNTFNLSILQETMQNEIDRAVKSVVIELLTAWEKDGGSKYIIDIYSKKYKVSI